MTIKALPAFACVLLLSACAGDYYGQGPLEIKGQAKRLYEDFQAKPYPHYFAVTENGRYATYSFCDASNCLAQPMQVTLKRCETRFRQGCKIYAHGRTIVWDFDAVEPASGN